MRVSTVFALFFSCCVAVEVTYAQRPRPVTIVTSKGETIQGAFRSATDTEAVIEVAGQLLRVPLDGVRTISFTGETTAPSVPAGIAAGVGPQKALAAMKSIRTATEIGVLRDQYSAKLQETLPDVREFVQSDFAGWHDLRLALVKAAEHYRSPMASIQNWAAASESFSKAARYLAYAETLHATPDEGAHVERPNSATLRIDLGASASGRLGFGDGNMPTALDESTDNGFHDKYVFTTAAPAKVRVAMTCVPCVPRLTVATEANEGRGSRLGLVGEAAVQFDALPNTTYHIWAGARQGDIGVYRLAVSPVR